MSAHQPSARRSIFHVIVNGYIKSALIPVVLIELALIAAYLVTNTLIRDENIQMMNTSARANLQETARLESYAIDNQLEAVTRQTALYAERTRQALASDYQPSRVELNRYANSEGGAWYTTEDTGGSALLYSAITSVGPEERAKAWRLEQLDPLMKEIVRTSDLVTQVYFNSHDSLNRIYPYFDVLDQYPVDIDIPSYNFYYLADAQHNPNREVVWTDVYVDPAGQGWLASAIAPVYRQGDDFLEGVVGLDIQVNSIIEHVLQLELAWDSYALLLDGSGTIMAMPGRAETDWGLAELTEHSYEEAIHSDIFKPDAFNIFKREDTRGLADRVSATSGVAELTLNGASKLASWSEIPNTGWRLLVVADEEQLYADANALKDRFDQVGIAMIAGLILFYLLFMFYLYRKSLRLSGEISRPMQQLEGQISQIADGDYDLPVTDFQIREVQHISDGLQAMSAELAAAHNKLTEINQDLEQRVRERTDELEQANRLLRDEKSEQGRLINELRETQAQLVQSEKLASLGQLSAGVAHEINNPLAFVSSNIDCLRDYTDSLMRLQSGTEALLDTDAQRKQVVSLKAQEQFDVIAEELPDLIADSVEGARRIKVIVDNLLDFSHISNTEWKTADINQCLETTLVICRNELKYKAEVTKELATLEPIVCIPSQINQVILTLLINAAQAIEQHGRIEIRTRSEQGGVSLRICDNGSGISAQDLPRIFDPFFTTKEVGQGTGLGLSVAYGIVNAHGGRIEVDSTPGEGSCFTVWLPETQT